MSNIKKYPCVLTIAGSDSSGGAGIQADIKTLSALNCYAASVITALTAQNTLGVQHVQPISRDFVAAQLEAVLTDINMAAIKIGMLFNIDIMETVFITIKKFKVKNIVLDPVMIAKNGCELLQPNTIAYLKNLFSACTLITPNIPEAEYLLQTKIHNTVDMQTAAITLGNHYKTNILVKGGHLPSNQAADVFFSYKTQNCHWFSTTRISTQHTHGTGCTLSSAIAAYLARDYPLQDAIASAKNYLTAAIQSGQFFQIGHGRGPVNHFHSGVIHHDF
jgi:hydroxymethylpyrimidine/phosphomethylpyrimidine kinase